MAFQERDTFQVMWTALGESLGDLLSRARAHLCLPDQPRDLLVPDPQPCEACLTIISAPGWSVRRGLNAIFVAGPEGVERQYVNISSYGVTLPEMLTPPAGNNDHRVDIYNTGFDIDTLDDIPPGTMLYTQRVGDAAPVLPSVAQLQANPLLDCSDCWVLRRKVGALTPRPQDHPRQNQQHEKPRHPRQTRLADHHLAPQRPQK